MKEIIAALLGAFGALGVGAIAAWVAVRVKRLDQIGAYDVKVLEQRLIEYRKLWKLTSATSRRHIASLGASAAGGLTDKMTNWYYEDGGMFLSEGARDAFFAARASLEGHDVGQPSGQQRVVRSFSFLRTALCEDVASRRAPSDPSREP